MFSIHGVTDCTFLYSEIKFRSLQNKKLVRLKKIVSRNES